MTHRASATAIGILAILALCAANLVRSIRRATESTTTYVCHLRSGLHAADVPTTASPPLIFITRRSAGKPTTWDVVQPQSKPMRATVFAAATGSIGGSHGLRWRTAHGTQAAAVLWFSDIVSDYGSNEIDVDLSLTGEPGAGATTLYKCQPDLARSSLG